MESAHQTEWLVRRFFIWGEFLGVKGKCTGYGTGMMVEYGRKARKIRKHTNTYAEIFDNFV